MKVALGVSLSLALALSASAALAQTGPISSQRIVSFGIGGGMSVPVSHAADAFKSGVNAQGFLRFNVPKLPVVPRLDLGYSKFDLDEAAVGLPGTGQILSGLANMQIFLIPGGPIRPYIVAGVGAYDFKTETEGSTGVSQKDLRFGINGGGGVVLKLGLISAYVEGRVDNVYTEEGVIDTKQIQVVPVTFGVVF